MTPGVSGQRGLTSVGSWGLVTATSGILSRAFRGLEGSLWFRLLADTTSRLLSQVRSFSSLTTSFSFYRFCFPENGEWFSWGSNSHGELGTGDAVPRTKPAPVPALNSIRPLHVACGSEHSIALLETGELVAWGSNNHGQLGLGDIADRLAPAHFPALAGKRVTVFSCGYFHSAAILGLLASFTHPLHHPHDHRNRRASHLGLERARTTWAWRLRRDEQAKKSRRVSQSPCQVHCLWMPSHSGASWCVCSHVSLDVSHFWFREWRGFLIRAS